jgi:hypothetical protein
VLALICAVGFAAQMGWATSLWPWPDSTVPYFFLGAIAAAIGAASLWVALSGELGAAVGGCVTLAVFYAALAVSLGLQSAQGGPGGLGTAALLCALGAAVFAGALAWLRRYPIRDTHPVPPLVRWSFYVYAGLLGIVGFTLLLGLPNTYPWALKPTTPALIGSFYVGASAFFAYALRRPSWGNAAAQLWAFLAYDLVLILPYLGHFSNVTPSHLPTLIANTAVLIYSGGLSIYYLLINPTTRAWSAAHTRHVRRLAGSVRARRPVEVAPPQ